MVILGYFFVYKSGVWIFLKIYQQYIYVSQPSERLCSFGLDLIFCFLNIKLQNPVVDCRVMKIMYPYSLNDFCEINYKLQNP